MQPPTAPRPPRATCGPDARTALASAALTVREGKTSRREARARARATIIERMDHRRRLDRLRRGRDAVRRARADARRRGDALRARRLVLRRGRASSARSATTSAPASCAVLATRGTDTRRRRARRRRARASSGPASTARTSTRARRSTRSSASSRASRRSCRAASRAGDVLFLANIQPRLQREVLDQCAARAFVALDSMDLWIETARDGAARRRSRASTA